MDRIEYVRENPTQGQSPRACPMTGLMEQRRSQEAIALPRVRSTIRLRAIAIAGCIAALGLFGMPALAQDAESEEQAPSIESTIVGDVDPSTAITTTDLGIPVDQLGLLVRPLTVEELKVEAAAWLLLLRGKVQEISATEIAIKQKNITIQNEAEATQALILAQAKLLEAETALALATIGTPKYERLAEQVEQATEQLQQAQQDIISAAEANARLQDDASIQEAIHDAEEAEEVHVAQQVLEEARKQQDELVAGSAAYEALTEKIDTLAQRLKQLEAAEEQLSRITPDSEEYEQLANRVNTIQWWVISAARAIAPEKFDSSQDESASLQSNNGPLSTSPTDAFLVADGGPNTSVLPTNVHPSTINPTDSIDAQLEAALAQLDSIVTTETDIKNQLLINATDLQEEQTAIIERFNVILNALEQKGGNVVSYRTYIDAISGIQLDLTDTQGMGIRLVGWIKSQDGGIRFVFSLLKFGGIICIATLVSPRLGKVSDTVLRQVDGVSALLRSFIVKLIKRGSFSAGMLLALASLGVNLGPVLALVGGASFVVAFALQSNLGNFASGLMLMVNKPFDVGDEVKIAGYWAFVHSISLANTKLKDWDGNLVTLPNNTVWGGDITNYTHRKIRKLKFGIHILLDQDIDYIRDMWFDVALSHPKVLQDPGPGIRPWNETYDYRIWIGLGAWTKTEDYWEVYLDLLKALQKRLELEGLELAATPVSDVNLLNLAETPSASLRAMAYAAKTEPDNAPVEVVIS